MINFQYCRLEAIKHAAELVNKWHDINRLIDNAYRFCIVLDEDFDNFQELSQERNNDDCLREVMHVASCYCGANNLLSALYYINGNHIQSDIWYTRYIHSANRAFNQKDELNDIDD